MYSEFNMRDGGIENRRRAYILEADMSDDENLVDGQFVEYDSPEQDRRDKWRSRVRRFMGGAALTGTCLAGVGAIDIQADINLGKHEVANSVPILHTIYKAPLGTAESEVATVIATGLGTRDSSYTAHLLTPYQAIGNVYAMEYSNRDINIEDLTTILKDQLEKDGIKYVVADGFSAGGPILVGVMAELQDEMPEIDVVSVILNSSPIGEDSLTRRSRDAVDVLQKLLQINPDLMYSAKVRLAAEILARHGDYQLDEFPYIDTDEFVDLSKRMYKTKYTNPAKASGSLVASQYRFLAAYNVKPSFKQLSSDGDNTMVFYTRAADAKYDTVVDVDSSEINAEQLADKYDLPYSSIRIDGIGHANPNSRTDEYNDATEKYIIPSIEQRIGASQLQKYIDDLNEGVGVDLTEPTNIPTLPPGIE